MAAPSPLAQARSWCPLPCLYQKPGRLTPRRPPPQTRPSTPSAPQQGSTPQPRPTGIQGKGLWIGSGCAHGVVPLRGPSRHCALQLIYPNALIPQGAGGGEAWGAGGEGHGDGQLQPRGCPWRAGPHKPGPPARCLRAPSPCTSLPKPRGGEHRARVWGTHASQQALPELLPQMKRLLKSFSKMQFSPTGNVGVCVRRGREGHHPSNPASHTVLSRETLGVGAAGQGHPTRARKERGRGPAGLGGRLGPGSPASAPVYPITLNLGTFSRPPRSPPQPHASPLGAEQEDHMEGIIRQLTFH